MWILRIQFVWFTWSQLDNNPNAGNAYCAKNAVEK